MAYMFISILELTDRKIFNVGWISMNIEELCVRGGEEKLWLKESRILLFLKGKFYNRSRYEIYMNETFLPFI